MGDEISRGHKAVCRRNCLAIQQDPAAGDGISGCQLLDVFNQTALSGTGVARYGAEAARL